MKEVLDESSLAQAIRSEGGALGVRVLVALARLAFDEDEARASVLGPVAAAETWLACPCAEHAERCRPASSHAAPDEDLAERLAASAAQAAAVASEPGRIEVVAGLVRRGFASFVEARARALASRPPTAAALGAMRSIVLAALKEGLATGPKAGAGRGQPLGERELVALIASAREQCALGVDAREPFDLAVEHMRRSGPAPALLAAIREYRRALAAVKTRTARRLRRRASVVLLLDDLRERTGCWSDRFRRDLAKLDAGERTRWQALVLAMPLTDAPRPSPLWQRRLESFADELGPPRVALRLAAWLPRPDGTAVSTAAGRELHKTFLWLREAIQAGVAAPL